MTIRKVLALISLITATLIWGITFPLVKYILKYLSEFQLLFLRFLVASFIGIFFVFRGRKYLKNWKSVFHLSLLGLSLYIAFVFQTVGLRYTTPTKSAFITGLYIVFTPILATLFLKEKIKLHYIIALILSLIGLLFLSNIDVRSLASLNIGDFLTLLCAVAFAFQIVLTELLVKNTEPLFVTSFEILIAFLFTIPFVVFNPPVLLNLTLILSVTFLGIFASFLALQAESVALRHIDSTEASLIFVLEPVFAYLFSFIIFREVLNLKGIMGAFLIIASMVIITIYDRE